MTNGDGGIKKRYRSVCELVIPPRSQFFPLLSPAPCKMFLFSLIKPKEYEKRYHRRSVIEGYFNGLKIISGNKIRARRRHNQNIELLSKVIIWNALVLSRYYARR